MTSPVDILHLVGQNHCPLQPRKSFRKLWTEPRSYPLPNFMLQI